MNKAGFKVIKLDWYCDFKRFTDSFVSSRTSMKKRIELIENLQKDGEENPLTYIEECGDPGFPPREHIKYCVAVKNGKPTCYWYKPYQCFCFQAGKWWRYKRTEYIFTELYEPQCMSHYEFCKYNSPLKFLSKDAYKDWQFHKSAHELRAIARNVDRSLASFFLELKRKKHKVKKQKSKLP